MISPTQLLIESLGIVPEGSVHATAPGRCVMCGGHYAAGDVIEPWNPPDTFFDHADLQNPNGTHICGACQATWNSDFMQKWAKSLVCKEGLFKFFSNDAVSHWILNPPEPPFLMFITTQKVAHVVWKTPVNLSRDLLLVRYNDKVLKIRRGHLLESVEAARLLSDMIVQARSKKVSRGPARAFVNPLSLDREMERFDHGCITDEARKAAGEDLTALQAIRTLEAMTLGEAWALTHVLYAKSDEHPSPELTFGQYQAQA